MGGEDRWCGVYCGVVWCGVVKANPKVLRKGRGWITGSEDGCGVGDGHTCMWTCTCACKVAIQHDYDLT